MATRSSIFIKFTSSKTKKPTVLRYYKHWDGYPTHNLELIGRLAGELKLNKDVKAAFKAATKKDDFANIEYEGKKPTLEQAVSHNEHGDLEWTYLVDLDKKQVKVNESYSGESKEILSQNGTDPLKYADKMREEYKNSERAAIQVHIDTLKSLGYKIN